ncbi:MAG: response regulator [Deltaproteobacteria bacterium]|nr:response regulator [Deltaproteobacteria bacterium]
MSGEAAEPQMPLATPSIEDRSLLDGRFALGLILMVLITGWSIASVNRAKVLQADLHALQVEVEALDTAWRALHHASATDTERIAARDTLSRHRPADATPLGANADLATLVEAVEEGRQTLWRRQRARSAELEAAWRSVNAVTIVGIAGVGITLFLLHVNRRRLLHAEAMRQRLAAALKEAESAREAAQRASRAKSDFIATVSHEIRTPMTAILGTMELLQHTPLTPQQRDCVAVINSGGDALLGVINHVLDLSRIESGHLELNLEPVELPALLDGVVLLFAGHAESRGLHLSLIEAPGLPARVMADGPRLRQVLVNLLGNAIKFTERGSVRLFAEPDAEAPGVIRLSVIDTGVGVPEADQQRIFDAFSQLGGPARSRGTGLGLNISRRLARAMGGELSVKSAPGAGSAFTFTLSPVWLAEPLPVPPPSSALIVGENPTLDAAAAQLTLWGAEVVRVPSHNEALAARDARDAPFNVAIAEEAPSPTLAHRVARVVGPQALTDAEPQLSRPMRPARLRALLGPAAAPQVSAAEPAAPSAAADPFVLAPRVLVVDDSITNRLVVTQLLKALGCVCVEAEDGEEGAARALAEPFDLIFMDTDMPRLDGLSATERIRAQAPKDHDRVMIFGLSGHADPEDRARALAVGMDDYLIKPIRVATLREVLARLSARRAP